MNILVGFILYLGLFLPEQSLIQEAGMTERIEVMAEKKAAGQKERSLATLACLPEQPHSQRLCNVLQEQISRQLPGYVFRLVKGTQPKAPSRPGDMSVTLRMVKQSTSRITARLEWQTGKSGLERGPDVQVQLRENPVSHEALEALVTGLLAATPGLIPAQN